MNIKSNKKLFNGIMVGIIAVIIVGGIAAVGSIKGWFGGSEESAATVKDIAGVVSIERKGVSFNLDKETEVEAGDIIRSNEKAGASVDAKLSDMDISENTELKIDGFDGDKMTAGLEKGEIFVTTDKDDFGKISARGNEITATESVFSVNVQTGSMGINVFSGEVTIEKGEQKATAKAGEAISVVGDEFSVVELQATSLNEFNIEKAKKAGEDRELCFSGEELDKVLEDRQNEIDKAAESSEGEGEGSETQQSSGNGSGGKGNSSGSSSSSGTATTPSGGETSALKCTIEIRCDTILNNMGDLEPGKEGYVPSSGIILRTTTVNFTEGETAFDVLNRICKARGIQIEYSYTPMYGSYYIEGINNLYEFDCGQQSGWMYKVNGWFPNYGCSSYTLKDGDTIVFCYTCKGLGADVGGSVG